MKGWVVNIIILLAISFAVYFFTVKFSKVSDFGRLKKGMAGINRFLLPGSAVFFKFDVPGESMDQSFVNYFIVPAKLRRLPEGNDTTLLLLPAIVNDPGNMALLKGPRVIWQNSDDRYNYVLLKP